MFIIILEIAQPETATIIEAYFATLPAKIAESVRLAEANDSISYIPDSKGFAEGAYETVTAQCAPGSGEALVEAATRLLVETYHRTPR